MLPKVIFAHPVQITTEDADRMARLVDIEYRAATGKENKLPGRDAPVVCASIAGIQGFWSLECNDPEIDQDILDRIVRGLRNWNHPSYRANRP